MGAFQLDTFCWRNFWLSDSCLLSVVFNCDKKSNSRNLRHWSNRHLMPLLVTVFFFHQMVNHFFSFNGYYHRVARTPEYLQWDVRPKCGDVNAVAPGWDGRLVVPWLSQFTVHLHTGDWLTMLNLQKSLFDSKFYQELQVNWIKNILASHRECLNNKIWSNR